MSTNKISKKVTLASKKRYFQAKLLYRRYKKCFRKEERMENLIVTTAAIAHKRVFLRADLNVPLGKKGEIADEHRLQALLPTLNMLVQSAARVVIATHLGKPNPGHPDPALSTKQLIPWFEQHQFAVSFAASPSHATELLAGGDKLILLENLRFFAGEQEPSSTFAGELAALADVYVTDAFGTLHRHDASIALLPSYFAPEKRFYGHCVAAELAALSKLRVAPEKPFVAIIGGNKLTTKLPLIQQLMTAPPAERVTQVLLGGLLGLDLAPELPALAKQHGVRLLTPIDYTDNNLDIGPNTIALFTEHLAAGRTIFANGTMGKYEEAAGQAGTKAILEAIGNNRGFTVIGGGDCGAAAIQCGMAEKVSFVSTGGGATLAFVASKEPWQDLPGLKTLINRSFLPCGQRPSTGSG